MATDNFTNTNGTALDTHNSLWDTYNGLGLNGEIYNNTCRPNGAWVVCAAMYNNSQPADQESQIIFKTLTALRYDRKATARASISSSGYELYFSNGSGNNFTTLSLSKNGSWFATLSSSGTWPYASEHNMKCKVYGTTTTSIEGWVDGSQIGSTQTDATTPITSGIPGFYIAGDGTQEIAVDDWTDNISGGGAKFPVPHLWWSEE